MLQLTTSETFKLYMMKQRKYATKTFKNSVRYGEDIR